MSQKQTAKKAIEILRANNASFRELAPSEKVTLPTVFARERRILYLNAFDIVKCQKKIDYANEDDTARNLESITVRIVASVEHQMSIVLKLPIPVDKSPG